MLKPEGALIIDEGAVRALNEGKSLLPAGVRQIDGRFERGDAVLVKDREGREIARGLAAYNAADAERIAGKRTVEIEAILGYRGRDEMIHRDDLVADGKWNMTVHRPVTPNWQSGRRDDGASARPRAKPRAPCAKPRRDQEQGAARPPRAAIRARKPPKSSPPMRATWQPPRPPTCPRRCWTA